MQGCLSLLIINFATGEQQTSAFRAEAIAHYEEQRNVLLMWVRLKR